MKKTLVILMTAMLLLSGCEHREEDSSAPSRQPPDSQVETSSLLPEDETPPEPPSFSREETFIEDDAFYPDVLLTYGGELDGSNLRPAPISLFYSNDWQSGSELTPGSFYTWRLCRMWNEDATYEQRVEKYQSSLGPDTGWFFEEGEYERLVQTYFDVDVEQLRSDPMFYNAELGGYCVEGGGGIGEQPVIELNEVVAEGDLRRLYITLPYLGGDEKKVLTIRMEANGAYKFISYQTLAE